MSKRQHTETLDSQEPALCNCTLPFKLLGHRCAVMRHSVTTIPAAATEIVKPAGIESERDCYSMVKKIVRQ
eukprot:4027322-Amphidinium_carterae.1